MGAPEICNFGFIGNESLHHNRIICEIKTLIVTTHLFEIAPFRGNFQIWWTWPTKSKKGLHCHLFCLSYSPKSVLLCNINGINHCQGEWNGQTIIFALMSCWHPLKVAPRPPAPNYTDVCIYCLINWLVDGSVNRLINLLIDQSVNWLVDCFIERLIDWLIAWFSPQEDLTQETLEHQFKLVKNETNTSHVLQFGDMTMKQEKVGAYQGQGEVKVKPVKVPKVPVSITDK